MSGLSKDISFVNLTHVLGTVAVANSIFRSQRGGSFQAGRALGDGTYWKPNQGKPHKNLRLQSKEDIFESLKEGMIMGFLQDMSKTPDLSVLLCLENLWVSRCNTA